MVTHFGLHGAHRVLSVRMNCRVEVGPRPELPADAQITWEAVRDAIRREPQLGDLEPASMSEPTPLVPLSDAACAYAAASFVRGRPWFGAVFDLMQRIHADFEFEPAPPPSAPRSTRCCTSAAACARTSRT